MPGISKTQDPSALFACLPHPGSASRRMRAPPSPAPSASPGGNVRMRCADPDPSHECCRRPWHRNCTVRAPEVRAAVHRSGLSAPGFSEALRDEVVTGINAAHRDGGQRSPIGIGPKPLDHHAAPRQQPDQRRPRGLARTVIAPCVDRCWRCAPFLGRSGWCRHRGRLAKDTGRRRQARQACPQA